MSLDTAAAVSVLSDCCPVHAAMGPLGARNGQPEIICGIGVLRARKRFIADLVR